MDVQKKLDDIVATVNSARSMPMSASCVVNRAELLALLGEVSASLPQSLAQAEEVLGERERMVAQAQAEAQQIIDTAHAERGSLVSDTQVARQSQDEAERILAEARREADEIRAEADDYVDSKLANFEVVLTKTIGSVDRGREKLLGLDPYGDAGEYGEDDVEAPERSSDPETLRRRADDYVDAKMRAFETVLSKTLEAVGRGRLKLTGHRPIDDLADHIAAADAEGGAGPRQSDDDYMAGLAAPAAGPQDLSRYGYTPAAAQAPQEAPAAAGYYQQQPESYPQQGGYDPEGYPRQQPEYARQAYDPYGAEQGYPQQADPRQGYEYGGQGYVQPDGTIAGQPYPGPPQLPYQQAPQYGQQPAAALDETSFFDTGMIDLNRLRELEQGL
ncbi:cell division initiation protein [Actinacidiphila yeochonensis]|uniref:cell division initiation protein n=1 Tax=Actinacidiphila yeochonensis TaxID=89050 RepID=UPI0005611062|nr:cell division initiation protein [Actinacidiphila yeochonensis]